MAERSSFIRRLLAGKQTEVPKQEPELNLGLSLGGIYNTTENPLTRSSTIAGEVVKPAETNFVEHSADPLPKTYISLDRACSLPAEVENSKKMAKVKLVRAMKRVEAKKRAEEKRSVVKGSETDKLVTVAVPPPRSPADIPAWAAASASRNPALNRAIQMIKTYKKLQGIAGSGASSSSNPVKPPVKPEAEITSGTPFNRPRPPATESQNPVNNRVRPPATESQNPVNNRVRPHATESQNPVKKVRLSIRTKDVVMAVLKRMPSVTSTGDGPNGRTIHGLLYKYTGGQVRIVCVCHGRFLSPEEFVEHAGCVDVTNPMRQINVCAGIYSE